MKILRDIIKATTPTDKAIESGHPFDTKLLLGLYRLLEAMKISTDDLAASPADGAGVRELGHNHGYGSTELARRENMDPFTEQLLGRHIAKRAATIDQVEDGNQAVTEPLAVIRAEMLENRRGDFILTVPEPMLQFLTGPGTTGVDVIIGCKSSGSAFDALFEPCFSAGWSIFDPDGEGWVTVKANSAAELTWIAVAVNVKPYMLYNGITPAVGAKNNAGGADLNVWAIRVIENQNMGIYSTGQEAGFFADIHQADLHTIEGNNIPDRKTP